MKALPVKKETAEVMTRAVRENVEVNTAIMTDEHGAYMKLSKDGWKLEIVVHSKDEWTHGAVHTQGNENIWSLKRQYSGSTIGSR